MAEDSGMLDNGAMVWVPHDEQVWKKAVVVRRLDDGVSAEVRLQPSDDGEWDKDDGLEQVVNIRDIARMAGEVSDEAMPIYRKKELKLTGDVTNYKYVAEGADAELTGIDDIQCLKETQDALDTIGISKDEQNAIFEIVAAILNLGEVEFEPNGNDNEKSHVKNEDIVDNVGALLGTESAALHSTLLERSITAGSESYTIPLNAEQALDLRDALAKGMYTQLFDWLVHRINKAICSTNNVKTHIGLLDIFGFESFDQNGFEQLCINYANEKLQQKFNSDVFKDVQQDSGLLQRLEDRRNVILKDHAILIQKTMHGYVHRKRFLRQRAAVVEMQAVTRGGLQAKRYRTLRAGVIKLQARERGRKQRFLFALLLERVRKERQLEQERLRKIAQEEEAERIRQKSMQEEREHSDPQPPVEDDWSDESDKEEELEIGPSGPVSPRTLRALTEAASKVAEAESAARDAKHAAESALELNRELVAQNDRLRSTLSSNVAEYADAELLRENERLKQQVLQLQTKLVRSQEVSLISAKVVDSRITYREGRQFVEYKLQIETNTRGTLYVWHRYSTFRNLAATLQTKNGYKRKEIPELPNKQLFGNFSEKIIQDRVAKLNQFLEAATNAEYLQWGIRVDQDTCVYKRRVKNASRESISTASMHSSSPRSSSRLSMKSFSFRRGSTAGN
ncbi:hypothetical protein PC112_g14778 [Phytophthora cactorum]|nr:hypothetical protein PC112_g14778 [Phytophthora cactorum]